MTRIWYSVLHAGMHWVIQRVGEKPLSGGYVSQDEAIDYACSVARMMCEVYNQAAGVRTEHDGGHFRETAAFGELKTRADLLRPALLGTREFLPSNLFVSRSNHPPLL